MVSQPQEGLAPDGLYVEVESIFIVALITVPRESNP